MMTNSGPWHALKSCLSKSLKARESNEDDAISQLPDEIMLPILYSFTMKEICRLGCVSRRWQFIWRCAPLLIFEDPQAIEKIDQHWIAILIQRNRGRITFPEERSKFVKWVDLVLDNHLGKVIDELRITFDLDCNWQSHVDKWAALAIDKYVKRLELDFTSRWRGTFLGRTPTCGDRLDVPPKLYTIKSTCLTYLRLKDVNVTDEFVNYLSHSCPLLEVLSIVGSDRLTLLQPCASLKHLNHLEVSLCINLKKIDIISAPKLRSFVYYNMPVDLHLSYVPSLSDVCVGQEVGPGHIDYVFGSLSKYFSQLVYLCLRINIKSRINLGIDNPPHMPNLRHLEFQVIADFRQSLRGWAPFIAAAPHVQKLTLKLSGSLKPRDQLFVGKWVGFPLKCLKTLELGGFVGWRLDLELAFFVFENAPMLDEVIVDFVPLFPSAVTVDDEERLAKLRTKLPQSVKLTIKLTILMLKVLMLYEEWTARSPTAFT